MKNCRDEGKIEERILSRREGRDRRLSETRTRCG
jgi:hypothetical protein